MSPYDPGLGSLRCSFCDKDAVGFYMRPNKGGTSYFDEAARILFCKEHENEALALSMRPQSED
jgi:hypothetical protein